MKASAAEVTKAALHCKYALLEGRKSIGHIRDDDVGIVSQVRPHLVDLGNDPPQLLFGDCAATEFFSECLLGFTIEGIAGYSL
ncbi:hypothetical protein [Stenotrophomonas maltophilia]|uniref:hypothetical protein n=1 Tax=Stenotrophomonas maltophilia TaxID=40324 RepID=UPI00209B3606|nr:hypothetical protein [Stenotrophomonas maltophilia]MCO7486959.1 hypothetical protein [Stenotrophomonas maltophilia]